METPKAPHTDAEGDNLWPKSVDDLPEGSLLRISLSNYAKRVFGSSLATLLTEQNQPKEFQTTTKTVLRAVQRAEENTPPVESPTHVRPFQTPWSVGIDLPKIAQCERKTYPDSPLTERNIGDLFRFTRTAISRLIATPDAEKTSNTVGHIGYDLRDPKTMELLTISLNRRGRGHGFAEAQLARLVDNLQKDKRVSIVDKIDKTHAEAAREDQRSIADACRLLEALGFEKSTKGQCRDYLHHESGCLIALPHSIASNPLPAADILGIGVHLTNRGLLTEDRFERFVKEGWLPEMR